MHIGKLANFTLYINMYSLSALYMLQSVPIVQVILVKKKEKTRTLVWVKIPKLCHKTPLSIFFLGKGREFFVSDFIQNQNLVRFLPCPPACKYFFKFRHCVDDTCQNSHKIDHKITFLQISHLSSNRRVCNLTFYFQFTTPNKRAHP